MCLVNHRARPYHRFMNEPEIRSLSELIKDLRVGLHGLPGDKITMAALIEAFHERGIGFLLLIFAAPMALPIPVPPGINIALATPLIVLTAHQALGAHALWLPRRMKEKEFTKEKLDQLFAALVKPLHKLEFLIRPRLGVITQDGPSRLFGLFGFLMALTVCIPVPLTNTVPSFGIALMAIGVTMRDGVAVLAGAMIGIVWIAILLMAVIFFGAEAADIIKDTIKSFFS